MAGNGGVQPSRENLQMPMQEGGVWGNRATGDGGNNTLINQDEARILDSTIEYGPYVSVENTWNGVEDDSHVQGVYAERDFAGS